MHGGELLERLRDERSRRVVFVSHCVLDENTRFLGGALRPGVNDVVVRDLAGRGLGIHQMPCPEQRAWGGVLRRWTLPAYGASPARFLARLLLPLFLLRTRWTYRRLARRVVRDLEDLVRAGIQVVGIVGIGGSPSCGVRRTLDLRRTLPILGQGPVDREHVVRAVTENAVAGEGLYVRALRRRLRQRGLEVPFLEWDLLAELRGGQGSLVSEVSPWKPPPP